MGTVRVPSFPRTSTRARAASATAGQSDSTGQISTWNTIAAATEPGGVIVAPRMPANHKRASELRSVRKVPRSSLGEAQKHAALRYILDAWEEALHDGVEPEMLANAALFAALADLIGVYGEDAVAKMTNGLSRRIHHGEFTLKRTSQ